MERQIFEYHSRISHLFIPGLKSRIKHEDGGYLIRTNSQGFRSNMDFETGIGSERRILLFGDSFTAGDGVSNSKRFSDILPAMVDNIEIYNYGMSATGTGQQYLIYQEFAKEVENDLVVIMILAENIRRVNSSYKAFANKNGELVYYQKPYYTVLQNGDLQLHNVPVKKGAFFLDDIPDTEKSGVNRDGKFPKLRKLINDWGLRDIAQRLTKFQPLPGYNSRNNPEWLLMKSILSEWIGNIESNVLIVPLPIYQYTEGTSDSTQFQKRFKELAEELGVYFHDPLEDFRKYSAAERRNFRFENDIHPTESGHLAIAKSLKPVLEKILES